MKLPVYAIMSKTEPNCYLRDTNGQPFQSSSKKFLELVLHNSDSLCVPEDYKESTRYEVKLIEYVELGGVED